MIVSTARADVSVQVDGLPAEWQCLVRRGMLFSECEGIEYWRLPESAALDVRADHGVEEAVVVLSGELVFHPEGEDVLPLGVHTGQGVLLPHGTTGSLVAVGDDTRLITVRGLSVAVSRSLPPRRPELAADTSG